MFRRIHVNQTKQNPGRLKSEDEAKQQRKNEPRNLMNSEIAGVKVQQIIQDKKSRRLLNKIS